MTTGSTSSSKTSASTSQHRPFSSSYSSSSSATSSHACAACRYQRRKCNPDCALAPYFPANEQHQFLNAHRLFGVSNILKIIRHLDPVQRADAMRSIIFQSNARAFDPIGGCYRIIRELELQLQRDSAELALVHHQLAICRAQAQAALSPATTSLANPDLLLGPHDDGGGGGGGGGDNAIYGSHLVQPRQQYCNYFCYDGGDNIIISDADSLNNIKNYSDSGIRLEVPVSPLLGLKEQQQPPQCVVDEQEVKPLADMFDIRRDTATGDDESSKNSATHNTGSFHSSQRKTET